MIRATKFGQPFRLDAKALAMAHVANGRALAIRPDVFGALIALPLEIAANQKFSYDLSEIAPTVEASDARLAELAAKRAARPATDKPEASSQIAVIQIDGPLDQRGEAHFCGMIDGYELIASRFAEANDDPAVGAIVLRINSPGGDAAGVDEAVRKMRKMADQSGKLVIAFADEQAASAAYWIAAGVGDEVMLPAMGEVGSIGCIGAWVDATEAYKAEGFAVHIMRDPPGKAAGHPAGPVAELADGRMTESVKAIAERFIEAMSDRRPAAGGKRAIRSLDGGMLTGKAAVDGGLADKVGSFEDALKRAAEAANRRRIDMKNASKGAMALMALGMTEESTEAQIAAAAERTTEDALVRSGLEVLTGQKDPDTMLATAGAWKGSHEKVAELAAKSTKADLAGYLASQVGKKITPATAWAKDGDGMPLAGEPAPRWAKMGIDEAKTFVGELPDLAVNVTDPKPTASHGLTDRELKICKDTGCDPVTFAKLKKQTEAARARA